MLSDARFVVSSSPITPEKIICESEDFSCSKPSSRLVSREDWKEIRARFPPGFFISGLSFYQNRVGLLEICKRSQGAPL